jgi:hypothetical protein
MPTTTASTKVDVRAVTEQLAHSESSTIYVDVPGAQAEANEPQAEVLEGDPALHVVFDEVRQKLAVRKATPEEVADAKAAAATAAHAPEHETSHEPAAAGTRANRA